MVFGQVWRIVHDTPKRFLGHIEKKTPLPDQRWRILLGHYLFSTIFGWKIMLWLSPTSIPELLGPRPDIRLAEEFSGHIQQHSQTVPNVVAACFRAQKSPVQSGRYLRKEARQDTQYRGFSVGQDDGTCNSGLQRHQ